ncbi:branched-chain amino acid ABC transporter permease [Bacillaceae bacterium]
MDFFIPLFISGITFGCIYILIALAFNIVFSSSNVINFAMGEMVMVGAIISSILYAEERLPFIFTMLFTMIIVALLGIIEYFVAVRPLRRKNATLISIVIATLGYSIVLKMLVALGIGKEERSAISPLGDNPITIGGYNILPQSILVVGLTIIILLLTWFVFNKTMLGLSIRATAFHMDGAKLMGINVEWIIALCFGVGGGIAALAGLLLAPFSYASPWIGLTYGIFGFAATIIGGLGNWVGSIVGGLALGFLEAFATGYIGSEWGEGIALIVMLLILFIRPSGLFGSQEVQEAGEN